MICTTRRRLNVDIDFCRLEFILAIAVKPFGYSRKVFWLQPYGCLDGSYSLFIGQFTQL